MFMFFCMFLFSQISARTQPWGAVITFLVVARIIEPTKQMGWGGGSDNGTFLDLLLLNLRVWRTRVLKGKNPREILHLLTQLFRMGKDMSYVSQETSRGLPKKSKQKCTNEETYLCPCPGSKGTVGLFLLSPSLSRLSGRDILMETTSYSSCLSMATLSKELAQFRSW